MDVLLVLLYFIGIILQCYQQNNIIYINPSDLPLEKLQTEQWTNGEISDAQSKRHAKAKEPQSSKSKNPKVVSEVASVPTEEDKSELTLLGHDSLRWEGALEDPIAEAQRLEVYRANRRKRYMASRQAFLQNNHTGMCIDSNTSKLNTQNKPGVLA